MRPAVVASGFFGAMFISVLAIAPTFVAKTAAARAVTAKRAAVVVGHGLVQEAPPPVRIDTERSEAKGPDPELEPPAEVITPKKAAAPAPAPAPAPKASNATPLERTLSFRLALLHELDSLAMCRRPGGPEGAGFAEVTFTNDGRARVQLSEPYASTPVGACVGRRLASAAAPFDGEPVSIKVRFEL